MNRLVAALRRRSHAIALGVIVLASLAYRLHASRACSLWLDEDYTHTEVVRSWPAVLAGPEPVHPPLFFVLTKLALVPFGYSETGLRAVSLGFGCVLLVAVYWLCLELGLAAVRALVVVALLAITPFFIGHAIEARQYALYPALGTLALVFVLRLLREPNRLRHGVGFAASAAAMAATHYFGVAYACALLAVLVWGLFARRRELDHAPRRVLAAGLVVTALLGVLALLLAHAVALARFYGNHKAGRGSEPWPVLLDALIAKFALVRGHTGERLELAFAVVGLALVSRSLRGVARTVLLPLTFVPCALSLCISSGHFVAPRYLAPSWVLYHVGACVALFALAERVRALLARVTPKVAPALAWLFLLVPVVPRLAEYPLEFGAGEDDYRGLERYFMAHLAPKTALVTFPGHAGIRMMEFEYPVNAPPIELEHFHGRSGIERYLIAEIHLPASRRAEFDHLIEKDFGLSAQAWRDTPFIDLPGTEYQRGVRARLLAWDGSRAHVDDRKREHATHHRDTRGARSDSDD